MIFFAGGKNWFYNTQPAVNVSLGCQKLYNSEALEIIGVEIIISQKKLFDA